VPYRYSGRFNSYEKIVDEPPHGQNQTSAMYLAHGSEGRGESVREVRVHVDISVTSVRASTFSVANTSLPQQMRRFDTFEAAHPALSCAIDEQAGKNSNATSNEVPAESSC